jgi:hypothetical protein
MSWVGFELIAQQCQRARHLEHPCAVPQARHRVAAGVFEQGEDLGVFAGGQRGLELGKRR